MNQQILQAGQASAELLERFCREQNREMNRLAKRLTEIFASGGQLLIGASGSLQSAAHDMASQFVFRHGFERPVLPAIALGSDPLLTARMNSADSVSQLLVRHYRAINSSNHLLLLLNSGRDAEELKAVRAEALANDQDVALLTYSVVQDSLAEHLDICLEFGTLELFRQLELSCFCGHLLCQLVETELFGG